MIVSLLSGVPNPKLGDRQMKRDVLIGCLPARRLIPVLFLRSPLKADACYRELTLIHHYIINHIAKVATINPTYGSTKSHNKIEAQLYIK